MNASTPIDNIAASTTPAPASGASAAERDARIAQALSLIAEGKTLSEVAQQQGVSSQAISQFLLSNVPAQYKQAQEIGLTAKLAQQGNNLETAQTHVEIARARETARFWMWVGERLLPRFAAKSEISGPGGGPIQIEDSELARRYAYITAMSKRNVIDAEIVSTVGTT